jgi:hypothetical protein
MKCFRSALIVTLLAACGCLEVDEALTINRDGSGTCELAYSISEQAIVQMKAMLKLKAQMEEAAGESDKASTGKGADYTFLFAEPADEHLRRGFGQYEKHGLVLEDLKVEARDGRRNVRMKISFPGLDSLSKTEFFPEHRLSIARNPEGSCVLELVPMSGEKVPRITDEDTVRQLVPLLSGFRVTLKVNTPGRITETNASEKSDRTATWTFDFDKNPNAVPDLQNGLMKVVFDGSGLDLPLTPEHD